jgi:hypothetical protein
MAAEAAKVAYLSHNGNNISTKCRSISFPREADVVDTTTFTANAHAYTPTLLDGTITASGPWDATLDGYLAPDLGVSRTVIYGPQGSTASDQRYTATAILTSYEVSDEVDGVIEWTAEWQISGDVTRDTF